MTPPAPRGLTHAVVRGPLEAVDGYFEVACGLRRAQLAREWVRHTGAVVVVGARRRLVGLVPKHQLREHAQAVFTLAAHLPARRNKESLRCCRITLC